MTMVRIHREPVAAAAACLPRGREARRGLSIAAIQGLLVVGLCGWLLLAPPAQGMMMLVPLSPAAARALPALALHDGTRLVATGPLPGSLLVYARRAGLVGRLLAHGVVPVASPPGGCIAGVAA